ncbi:MAG: hypothetical protein LBI39_01185 [Puniceicoccales bacterium]|jgi:hypothetical protein|nr:hypothetical protein [Puniceicoccales bacterium]
MVQLSNQFSVLNATPPSISLIDAFPDVFSGGRKKVDGAAIRLMTAVEDSYNGGDCYVYDGSISDSYGGMTRYEVIDGGNEDGGYVLYGRSMGSSQFVPIRSVTDKYFDSAELYLKVVASGDMSNPVGSYVSIYDLVALKLPEFGSLQNYSPYSSLVYRVAAVTYSIGCLQMRMASIRARDIALNNAEAARIADTYRWLNGVKRTLIRYDSMGTLPTDMSVKHLYRSSISREVLAFMAKRRIVDDNLLAGVIENPSAIVDKYHNYLAELEKIESGKETSGVALVPSLFRAWTQFVGLLRHGDFFSRSGGGDVSAVIAFTAEQLAGYAHEMYEDAVQNAVVAAKKYRASLDAINSTIKDLPAVAISREYVLAEWYAIFDRSGLIGHSVAENCYEDFVAVLEKVDDMAKSYLPFVRDDERYVEFIKFALDEMILFSAQHKFDSDADPNADPDGDLERDEDVCNEVNAILTDKSGNEFVKYFSRLCATGEARVRGLFDFLARDIGEFAAGKNAGIHFVSNGTGGNEKKAMVEITANGGAPQLGFSIYESEPIVGTTYDNEVFMAKFREMEKNGYVDIYDRNCWITAGDGMDMSCSADSYMPNDGQVQWTFDPRIRRREKRDGHIVFVDAQDISGWVDGLDPGRCQYFRGFSKCTMSANGGNEKQYYTYDPKGEKVSSFYPDRVDSAEFSVRIFSNSGYPKDFVDMKRKMAHTLRTATWTYGGKTMNFLPDDCFEGDGLAPWFLDMCSAISGGNSSATFKLAFAPNSNYKNFVVAEISNDGVTHRNGCAGNFGGGKTVTANGSSFVRMVANGVDFWPIPADANGAVNYLLDIRGFDDVADELRLACSHVDLWADALRIYSGSISGESTRLMSDLQRFLNYSQQSDAVATQFMKAMGQGNFGTEQNIR